MGTGPAPPSPQDEVNLKVYARRKTVKAYTTVHIHPPEAVLLVRYQRDFVQRRVLELGCGAGRLAAYLSPLTDHYVGFDLSAHMVNYCRSRFPGIAFHQGDMRDLTRFDAGAFRSVVAINNLLDAVSHEDRLRVLDQVRRVLEPGGLLVFSAHNINCSEGLGSPRLRFTANPCAQVRNIGEYIRSVINHALVKPRERREAGYALLNDTGHRYSVLHYYIDRKIQGMQLRDCGFNLLECVDDHGHSIGPEDDDSACASIYYVARRQ